MIGLTTYDLERERERVKKALKYTHLCAIILAHKVHRTRIQVVDEKGI